MTKALFLPVSIAAGIIGNRLGKKLFSLIWSTIDQGQPPDPKQRVDDPVTLIAALTLEGAITRAIRGGIDHASRHTYARITGTWPGEESSESK
jgi:hypothetical protein